MCIFLLKWCRFGGCDGGGGGRNRSILLLFFRCKKNETLQGLFREKNLIFLSLKFKVIRDSPFLVVIICISWN
jgi:hypothetical protein